jgi:hypothetical protein
MYTLRTIETDGREVNLYLGTHFTIIKRDNVEWEHFNFELNNFFGNDTDDATEVKKNQVKSFIAGEYLPNSLPIYYDRQYYIVTESGKTFQKL